MNVGFHYMANAGGRLAGTALSGWAYAGRLPVVVHGGCSDGGSAVSGLAGNSARKSNFQSRVTHLVYPV